MNKLGDILYFISKCVSELNVKNLFLSLYTRTRARTHTHDIFIYKRGNTRGIIM